MKYYVYISDAKVDMLYAQMDNEQRTKISRELKINLGVLRASNKVETEPNENRIARLDVVVKHILANEWCGSLDDNAPYISDTLPMHWGRLRNPGRNP